MAWCVTVVTRLVTKLSLATDGLSRTPTVRHGRRPLPVRHGGLDLAEKKLHLTVPFGGSGGGGVSRHEEQIPRFAQA